MTEARLEVQAGKSLVGLVGVAGEEGGVVLRDPAQRVVFGSTGRQGGFPRPVRQRFAQRIAGQEVLGQHDEADVLAQEALGGPDLPTDAGDRLGHPGTRRGGVRALVHGMAGDLQGERPVGSFGFGHALGPR